MSKIQVRHTVKQMIQTVGNTATKPCYTKFTSKDAAERFAASVGGKVLPPAKTGFGLALARAIEGE